MLVKDWELEIKKIIADLRNSETPVLLILNKIDKMSREQIIDSINQYRDLYDFASKLFESHKSWEKLL